MRVVDLGRRRPMEPVATTHRCHSWTKPVTAVGNPVIGIPTESAPASFEQDRRGGCSSQVWTRDAERRCWPARARHSADGRTAAHPVAPEAVAQIRACRRGQRRARGPLTQAEPPPAGWRSSTDYLLASTYRSGRARSGQLQLPLPARQRPGPAPELSNHGPIGLTGECDVGEATASVCPSLGCVGH